eukprot:5985422-Prymnesium_polylepis.1
MHARPGANTTGHAFRSRVARARNATFVNVPLQMTGGLRAPYTLCSGQKVASQINQSSAMFPPSDSTNFLR